MSNLCKDCKHYALSESGPLYDRCKAPSNATLDLVRGENTFSVTFCKESRIMDSACGKVARWFEPISEQAQTLRDAGVPELLNGMDTDAADLSYETDNGGYAL